MMQLSVGKSFGIMGLPPMVEGGCMKELENSTINEDYSEYVKYSIQIKGTRTMPSEYFKTEQEANEYATKIGLKQDEYSVIQWFGTPYIEDQ